MADKKLFKDQAELDAFGAQLQEAFTVVLQISAVGSLNAGVDVPFRTALFAELLARMHKFKMDKAREVATADRPDMAKLMDDHIAAIWPTLQEKLERDISAGVALFRDVKGEEVH